MSPTRTCRSMVPSDRCGIGETCSGSVFIFMRGQMSLFSPAPRVSACNSFLVSTLLIREQSVIFPG